MRYRSSVAISSQQDRALAAALDAYFAAGSVRPHAWALTGRAEALGLGALQLRNQSTRPWGETRLNPYTRRGIETRVGRGDAR